MGSEIETKRRRNLLVARVIWVVGGLAVIATAALAFVMRDFPHGSGAGLWLIPLLVAVVAFLTGGLFWLHSREEEDAG